MDKVRPQRKILRSPSVKRKSKVLPINQRVQLQRVLGLTVSSSAGIACDSNYGTIAYPAGCVVVLFNPRRNKQSYIFNTTKKPVTCLAFSRDGKHLVTGETGHQPAVRIWDVQEKTQVVEFHGHKFGISCVAFSPNMKEVVSVGTQHDMMINVWNWKTTNKVASNKVSSKVSALAFSEDGKCFVTVGSRHVRFWYLDDKKSKINQTVPLMGRSGILGDQKDNFFCDVVAGQGHMCGRFFVITQSGLLCEFDEKRLLDKWVELRTKSANCITAGQEHIFVGCAEGIVRVFSATTLHYLCSLPKPHHLGVEVTAATNPSHMVCNRADVRYPDTKAITIDDDHKKVTCIYNDQSVYIWDVHDIKRVGKAWSFLYHSGCIWALEVYPSLEDESKARLPPGSFLTASGDNTIRVWNLNTHMPENTSYRRNIYSNELLKVVYVDPSLSSLCSVDYNPAGGTDKTDTTYDGKNGVRSIRVSPDGADLASGDRQGNVRIYDMQYMTEKKSIEAHDSDVMCLEYSYTNYGSFLATSSRDRLIHVFDVEENYGLMQTLGDHSSSITAVRFTESDSKLRMISCGADKSILLRHATTSPDLQFQLEHHLATKITLYDMVIDPAQKMLATACQDRNVRLFNIQTTKEKKCYKGSVGDEGVLLRMHLDPSGTYLATTCTDKNVCIMDFLTGELVATMYGHSEVITGVKFVNDLKHVITVSADGCIYVWRLPAEMTTQMTTRLLDLGITMKDADYFRSDHSLMPNPVLLENPTLDGSFPVVKSASTGHISVLDEDRLDGREDTEAESEDLVPDMFEDGASHASLDYRFSLGPLPSWAKAKFGGSHSEGSELGGSHSEGSEQGPGQVQPKGRWAQRADPCLEFKSELDLTPEEEAASDRRLSPESSSGKLAELRRETVVLSRQPVSKSGHVLDAVRRSEGFTQYKSDTTLNRSPTKDRNWSERFSFLKSRSLELEDTDELDTGSDTTEIIYPPTDSDSDLFASSYRIVEIDDAKHEKKKIEKVNSSLSQDNNSVSTEPTSLEDDEDPNDETQVASAPTTPSDPDKEFLPGTPEKEDFVKDNFEEDVFTPVPLDKFTRSLDSLEQQMSTGAAGSVLESTPFSPRLSLSARFMSRAQPSTFKNFSSQITYRQDNWFSRNKMEVTKALDDTRRSLISMNLSKILAEPQSPDDEDSPSPPSKLDQVMSLHDNEQESLSKTFSVSPHTVSESEIVGTTKSGKNTLRLSTEAHNLTFVKPSTSSSTISTGQSAPQEQQDKGRSEAKLGEVAAQTSGEVKPAQKLIARARPTYFKPTLSSKNRASRHSDVNPATVGTDMGRSADLASKRVKPTGRLSGSKLALYASTPNLISGLDNDDDEDDEPEEKPRLSNRFTSVSNLRQLADLSQSVPDVKEAGPKNPGNLGALGTNSQQKSTVESHTFKQPLPVTGDRHTVSEPKSLPTHASSSVTAAGHSRPNNVRESHPPSNHRKSFPSDLTLDQAKNILLGKSGVLASGSKPSSAGSSINSSSTILSTRGGSQKLVSPDSTTATATKTAGMIYDSELAHTNPSQLAVAEEIEHTANMLRHQKQASIISAFSSDRTRTLNLEASPMDLPERDQPRKPFVISKQHIPSASSSQVQNLVLPGTFQHALSSRLPAVAAADSNLLAMAAENCDVFEDSQKTDPRNQTLLRDGFSRYQPETGAHGSSPSRRILPASPHTPSSAATHGENYQPEASFAPATSPQPGRFKQGSRTGSLGSMSEVMDRSGLALQLPASASQPSLHHCQTAVNDFRSNVNLLKELFLQVDGRTDEQARQVLTMLGEAAGEAIDVLSEIVHRTSGLSPKNSDILSNHLTSALQNSRGENFHSSTLGHQVTDAVASSSSTAGNLVQEDGVPPQGDKGAILTATKDLLQPLVSQLSQDLSEGIWKLIKERVEETF